MNKESKEMKESIGQESFEDLAQYLVKMNEAFQQSAASAVNKHVTCRNWLNGYFISCITSKTVVIEPLMVTT